MSVLLPPLPRKIIGQGESVPDGLQLVRVSQPP